MRRSHSVSARFFYCIEKRVLHFVGTINDDCDGENLFLFRSILLIYFISGNVKEKNGLVARVLEEMSFTFTTATAGMPILRLVGGRCCG